MIEPPPPFPLRDYLGFEVERGEGSATAWLVLDERHLNPNGVMHGAVPFALMDTAMGTAAMSVVPEGAKCATIEVHTRFHASAVEGMLHAEATVTSVGRRIVHLQARTHRSDGKLVASATGSFAVVDPRGPE